MPGSTPGYAPKVFLNIPRNKFQIKYYLLTLKENKLDTNPDIATAVMAEGTAKVANFDHVNVETINVNSKSNEECVMNDCTIARESTVTDMGIAAIDAAEQAGYASTATAERIGLAADATAQRGFNHADGTAQRMAIAELDAIGRVGNDVCDSSRDIMRDLHSVDNHVSGVVERHGLHNNDSIERSSDKTQGVVQSEAHRTQDELEKFGFRELDAINSAEKYLFAGMSQNAKETLLEFERTKLLINANAKDALLQACGNAKDAALAARDLMHQADKNTAAIQLEAFRHKEELARQIAECCCEQKELTRATASQTQDLIRDSEKERLRDERDKFREELMALRVRATLPPPLVGSVPL